MDEFNGPWQSADRPAASTATRRFWEAVTIMAYGVSLIAFSVQRGTGFALLDTLSAHRWIPLVVAGALSGFLIGGPSRRFIVRRWGRRGLAIALAALLLVLTVIHAARMAL